MARGFVINGECLVRVKGGAHFEDEPIGVLSELGLSSERIVVTPRIYRSDLRADSFGPNLAPETRWMGAELNVRMTLVHFDDDILDLCVAESMMGGQFTAPDQVEVGTLPPLGLPYGGYRERFASGNRYISLNLSSPVHQKPWRFLTCLLDETPLVYPVGTERSLVDLNWRVMAYEAPPFTTAVTASGSHLIYDELICSGLVLWDRNEDT